MINGLRYTPITYPIDVEFDSLRLSKDRMSMLIYRRTTLLESNAQTLVNTVNCVGVMGKGLAQEFKSRYPDMFAAYQRICDRKLLEPGKLWVWPASDHLVLNFPTKKHWRNPSRLEWIEAGLEKFVDTYKRLGVREISFPKLGCGNGGLDWANVRPLMERYLSQISIPVFIHDFTKDIGLPEHLEFVPRQIENTLVKDDTFITFVEALGKVLELSSGSLVQIGSESPFSATIKAGELSISSNAGQWVFETDDLRGIWYRLRKGLVTAADAEWSIGGGGQSLVSILSLLPDVRPVEICRSGAAATEIAAELKPSVARAAAIAPGKEQLELTWH